MRLFVIAALLSLGAPNAFSAPPPDRIQITRRGVNVTHWFRYPPSSDPDRIAHYMTDSALQDLRRAGFTFIRLPIQPQLLTRPGMIHALSTALRRIQAAGLAVMPVLAPDTWHLETSSEDRAALVSSWKILAPALRPLPPHLTFPELLNEPVFRATPQAWESLQGQLLTVVRASLPAATIVLTGPDWSSADALLKLEPASDPNVLYTFHYYEPPDLTSLAAWRSDVDRNALRHLSYPVEDVESCLASVPPTSAATSDLVQFYCRHQESGRALVALFSKVAGWAAQHKTAVILGEFGATAQLNSAARLNWITAVREASEENGLGWALWGYDDIMGFNVPVPLRGFPQLSPEMLTALGLRTLTKSSDLNRQ